MDNLSQTDVILSKCLLIPHNFRRDAWWNLWSSGSYGSLDSQNKMALPSMYRWRWRHIHAFIGKIRLHLGYKGSQWVLIWYASHTPQTDELPLILWSTVSRGVPYIRGASHIRDKTVGNKNVDNSDVVWSIACRRCSNYIFILNLTPGFNGLSEDNCMKIQETFKFWDLVRLILEVLRYCWQPQLS